MKTLATTMLSFFCLAPFLSCVEASHLRHTAGQINGPDYLQKLFEAGKQWINEDVEAEMALRANLASKKTSNEVKLGLKAASSSRMQHFQKKICTSFDEGTISETNIEQVAPLCRKTCGLDVEGAEGHFIVDQKPDSPPKCFCSSLAKCGPYIDCDSCTAYSVVNETPETEAAQVAATSEAPKLPLEEVRLSRKAVTSMNVATIRNKICSSFGQDGTLKTDTAEKLSAQCKTFCGLDEGKVGAYIVETPANADAHCYCSTLDDCQKTILCPDCTVYSIGVQLSEKASEARQAKTNVQERIEAFTKDPEGAKEALKQDSEASMKGLQEAVQAVQKERAASASVSEEAASVVSKADGVATTAPGMVKLATVKEGATAGLSTSSGKTCSAYDQEILMTLDTDSKMAEACRSACDLESTGKSGVYAVQKMDGKAMCSCASLDKCGSLKDVSSVTTYVMKA